MWKKNKEQKIKPRIRTGGKIFEWKIFAFLRYVITGLLAVFFKMWWTTLRMKISEESLKRLKDTPSPAVIIFWHNNLFTATYWSKMRPKGKLYAMMSAGTIGAWIEPFYSHFNIKAIRGSINLRATQALKEIVQTVRSGNDIVITPDGSRGPCYKVKPGVSLVLKMADPAILLFSCKFHSAWRLNTWDRFYIPKPFSKVETFVEYFHSYKDLSASDDIADISQALNNQLLDELNFD